MDRRRIEVWLTSYGVYNYTINGDFHCNKNNLSTLEGCPIEVGGGFLLW